MTKTLVKHGNSHALLIDRTMMELMGIDAKTPLDVQYANEQLTIKAQRNGRPRPSVMAAYAHVSKKHAAFLKRLA